MRRRLSTSLAIALLAVTSAAFGLMGGPQSAAGATPQVSIDWPANAVPGRAMVVTITLPRTVAAVDGRLLFDAASAELLGVAPLKAGRALARARAPGGASFGAFSLRPSGNPKRTVIGLVVVPKVSGRLEFRVAIDSAADRNGGRLSLSGAAGTSTIAVGTGRRPFAIPGAHGAPDRRGGVSPPRASGPTLDPLVDGVINKRDLDVVRVGWEAARDTGQICGIESPADVNDDGCVDSVDIAVVLAAQGTKTGASTGPSLVSPAVVASTYVVTSTADTADAVLGDAICADSLGRCTLRSALAEADSLAGDDRIDFDIPGSAPATIHLTSRLPIIAARNGTVTIDGYSQPGSQPNTAAAGSNAIQGVEIRGNGSAASEAGLEFTSPGNTVRGLMLNSLWRGIVFDGPDARDNVVVGNWIGFRLDQGNGGGESGILITGGANHNTIGTADVADRNVIGFETKGIESYGPGVDGNVIQGNLLCIRPNGGQAFCATGIDHDFGPKGALIGGSGPNEGNVIGRTSKQGIELSHGWDPARPWGTDTATTWQINGHHIVGNWVGFRADGSYDPAYRSGYDFSNSDNGNGINVYDGTNDNLIEGNWIGSVFDGLQLMAPNSHGNIFRANTIGESPLGEPAPMAGWGIKVRWGTKFDQIEGNIIRNAAAGGIGLMSTTNTGAAQSPPYNIRLSQNLVFDTDGPAIYLQPTLSNPAKGANNLTVAPIITSASPTVVAGMGAKSSTVELYSASRAAGQSGLPTRYLGSTTVAPDGKWSFVPSDLVLGDRVTALQIKTDSNTSALSANVAVEAPPPPPGPGDPIAQDDFGRIVSAGWGAADVGGAYTYKGAQGDFSVADGVGKVRLAAGQSREARLAVGLADVGVYGRVSFDRLPTTGNVYAYVVARANNNDSYRAAIRVAPSGAVFVQLKKALNAVESNVAAEVAVTGLSAAGGAQLAFRLEVVGTHLQFRVWSAAGTEPTTWQTIAENATAGLGGAGAVGLRAVAGSPVPNGPVIVSFDGLEVRPAELIVTDLIATDAFERTLAGAWGTADLGGTWALTGTATDFAVSGGMGRISTGAGKSREARLAVASADVTISGLLSFDRIPATGNEFAYLLARANGTTAYRAAIRVAPSGAVFVQLKKSVSGVESSVAPEVAVAGLSASGGASLAFRFEVVGTHLQFRVWSAAAAEPAAWQTSADDTTAGLSGPGAIGLRAYVGSPVPNGPVTVSLDGLEVRRP